FEYAVQYTCKLWNRIRIDPPFLSHLLGLFTAAAPPRLPAAPSSGVRSPDVGKWVSGMSYLANAVVWVYLNISFFLITAPFSHPFRDWGRVHVDAETFLRAAPVCPI
ncbi:hypothetical protein CTA2_11173, partial [Colletotrichum tanaceti]